MNTNMNTEDAVLEDCLEEYHQLRDEGARVSTDQFADRLRERYDEFRELVATSELLEATATARPEEQLPRPLGRYQLQALLGEGAHGKVYRAWDPRLGRPVAVKCIASVVATEEEQKRFEREGRACAAVPHRALVQIHDVDSSEDGQPYIVMEYVDGPTLKSLIASERVPPGSELFAAMAGVADGLDALHSADVIHRDVKPGNLAMRPDGSLVLLDFGIAHILDEQHLTATGFAPHTPQYASPEQLRGASDLDGTTDVYSLGSTLFHALTGKLPFPDAGSGQVTKQPHSPPLLRGMASDVSSDAEHVVRKAMEGRPEDRYVSAGKLGNDLRALAVGEPVLGRPLSKLRRTWRNLRVPLVALAAAALVIAVGVHTWLDARPATLSFESTPAADVFIDDARRGRTPLSVEVDPGQHTVLLREEDFEDWPKDVDVEAGQGLPIPAVLTPRNRKGLAKLADAVGVTLISFEHIQRLRDPGPAIEVLVPRGDVRLEDLATCRLEVSEVGAIPADATIEFRRAGEILFSQRLEADPSAFPFPNVVRGALKPGETVEWGVFESASGTPVATAKFRVAAGRSQPTDDVLVALALDQPLTAAVIRISRLTHDGLLTAALAEAESLTRDSPESPWAWGAVAEVLRKLDLLGSGLAQAAVERFEALPGADGLREVHPPR